MKAVVPGPVVAAVQAKVDAPSVFPPSFPETLSFEPALVLTRPAHYLTLYGIGEPGAEAFEPRFGALYSVVEELDRKARASGRELSPSMPEALIWGVGVEGEFLLKTPTRWQWMLCTKVPRFVTTSHLAEAVGTVLEKDPKRPNLSEIRLKSLTEGVCVEMVHVGPYETIGASVLLMKEFADREGWRPSGAHHEIYLSDPRVETENRTILRQPVKASIPTG